MPGSQGHRPVWYGSFDAWVEQAVLPDLENGALASNDMIEVVAALRRWEADGTWGDEDRVQLARRFHFDAAPRHSGASLDNPTTAAAGHPASFQPDAASALHLAGVGRC